MGRQHLKFVVFFLVLLAFHHFASTAEAQAISLLQDNIEPSTVEAEHCASEAPQAVREALRLACLHTGSSTPGSRKAIIIGFVGGFVRQDDLKHPEVHFASLLRETYPSTVHVEVFSNHQGKQALSRVMQLVDENGDGIITDSEKEQANIIIYGHSWGGSQTVTLARAMQREGIPVLLTIQIDSVRKPRQDDSIIPANVRKAINFYQTNGPIHGKPSVRAVDPALTDMLGNVQMNYENRKINCDNYTWFPRHFNKPHHEIENDPEIWAYIDSLIASELSGPTSVAEVSLLTTHKR